MELSKLEELAGQWRDAKRAEERARDERVNVEQQIIALTGCKEEGSKTHEAGDFKITVTGKLNRKLDLPIWRDIESKIPENLRPVTYKPSLDLKGLRYLQNNEPEIYAIAAKAIETKPAKTAINIKEA